MDICNLLPYQASNLNITECEMSRTIGNFDKKASHNNKNLRVDYLKKENGGILPGLIAYQDMESKRLPLKENNFTNALLNPYNRNSNYLVNTSSDLSDDNSRNSSATTATSSSGSNSTTSSKIKLTSSPTDSLAKSTNCLKAAGQKNFQSTSLNLAVNNTCSCCKSVASSIRNSKSNNASIQFEDFDNYYQIMKLIDEHKTCICPSTRMSTKVDRSNKHSNELADVELYSFNLFKSGGFIEIPKYGK